MTKIDINENNDLDQFESRKKLDLLKKEIYETISKEFDISKITAEKLTILKRDTKIVGVDNLKNEIKLNYHIDENDKSMILSLTSERLESLYKAISGAEKLTNKEYLENIEVIIIGDKTSLSKKLFPKLFDKSINPEKKTDQIIGFCLGGLDSCSTTLKFLFDIGTGITKSPIHTYLIISGKGQYKKLDKWYFILALIIIIIVIGFLIFF